MGHKTNIDSAERTIYFAASGDDNFSGKSREVPKKTIQAAINAASALGPTPITPTSVIGAQGGIFTESFLMADFVQLTAPGIFFEADQTITVECSSLSGITGSVAINALDNGAVFEIDTQDSFGIDMAYTSVTGNNAVVFDIKGACESIFIDVNSNQISGDDSICYRFTGTASSILFFAASQVDLLGSNSTAVVWDSPSIGAGAIEAITTNGVDARTGLFVTGSDSTAFEIKRGIYNANIAMCKATTIIKVDAGATLNIEMTDGDGVIVVDGTLNCDIIKHSGSITNNGTINGNINGVPFGSYRQKHKEETVLAGSSFVDQVVDGTDNFMQVEFGAAQFGSSDPVQLSAAGAVTINRSDQYNLSVVLQYGRDGAAGSFALVFFRVLIDGNQVGNSVSAKLDNPNQAFPVQFELALDLVETQVLTLEFWRDSSGFNAGSLFTEDPVISGANGSASAAIVITRNRNVQPI